ncbi:MAG: DUF3575 domain-containing protein [Flavobacteriales bacterium]|jgi:hypothetical protein|tara:strand:- start:7683 stop:8258 length:576 start_codon:yes stop_codon:yes gene_type:complete
MRFFSFLMLMFFLNAHSQSEIKFNLATSLVLVPNIGIELKINENIGYQLDTSASFWDSIDGSPYQFVQIFNELRFYFKKSNRSFFIGPHIGYGMFTLRNPKFLTSIIDTGLKEEGSYQSGRNTYYGLTIGKKIALKNPKFGLEFFLGFGSSQSNYKYYNSNETRDFELDRVFSKSGEELPYKGGIMLVYKL